MEEKQTLSKILLIYFITLKSRGVSKVFRKKYYQVLIATMIKNKNLIVISIKLGK